MNIQRKWHIQANSVILILAAIVQSINGASTSRIHQLGTTKAANSIKIQQNAQSLQLHHQYKSENFKKRKLKVGTFWSESEAWRRFQRPLTCAMASPARAREAAVAACLRGKLKPLPRKAESSASTASEGLDSGERKRRRREEDEDGRREDHQRAPPLMRASMVAACRCVKCDDKGL